MKKFKKIAKISGIGLILLITALALSMIISPPIRSAITQVSGLAVAQTAIKWNNVKDAAVGDAQTSGLLASGQYVYDQVGATWNRMRGTASGLTVNGDKTPGDTFANPTDAIGVQSFTHSYNGTTWDRVRGDTTSGLWVNVKTSANVPVYTTISSTIVTGQVIVDTTVGGILIKALNASRRSIMIRNHGATDMYVGPTGVTIANGFLIKASETLTLDRNTAAVYGITAAGSTIVGYLEE